MRRFTFLTSVTLALILITAPSMAQWVENGNPLRESPGSSEGAVSIPIEGGGAIIVWPDEQASPGLYAQRVDGYGNALWGPDGVVVCSDAGAPDFPLVVADEAGGCIISWADSRNLHGDVYAQRLDPDGTPLWAPDGVPVCTDPGHQIQHSMEADGHGGAYIMWNDWGAYGEDGVTLTRIGPTGAFVWPEEIVRASWKAGEISGSSMTVNAAREVIAVWSEDKGASTLSDIFAMKFDEDGEKDWYGEQDFSVESFFDAGYVVNFEGCPGSPLMDLAGVTVGADTLWVDAAIMTGNGSGTIDMPPAGYDYIGEMEIIDGLPPGSTIAGTLWLGSYTNVSRTPGGNLGGEVITCDVTLRWQARGSGDPVNGFSRDLYIPGTMELHTGPTSSGDDLRTMDMELFGLYATLFGDPDFCTLMIYMGTDYGFSGQGVTSLYPRSMVEICGENSYQYHPRVVDDGQNGAHFIWMDTRSVDSEIYGQSVDYAGNLELANSGVRISPASALVWDVDFIGDGEGGAYVNWKEYRSGNYNLYALRLDSSLAPSWTSTGVQVNAPGADESDHSMALHDNDGIILAWGDYGSFGGDIMVQHLDGSGNERWTSGGEPLCTAPGFRANPVICSDGTGGALVAWHDERDTGHRTYATRIDRHGNWGWPAPGIVSVQDVPGDQGGQVDLAWNASRLDPWPEQDISHYTVWRSITADKVASLEADVRVDKAGDKTIYWQLMETIDAAFLPGYSTTVPTLFDSTTAPPPPHFFQVMAHASQYLGYWESSPIAGYSVDNLAPAMPKGLAGAGSYQPDQMDLIWDANAEEDLLHYVVHRGLSAGFVPDASSLVTTTPDTTALDGSWDPQSGWHYKVAAVDIHQNISGYALLVPGEVSGVSGAILPTVTALQGNHPNPFNPGTVIQFDLGQASTVRLSVFDVAGRQIRTLVDGATMQRGRHGEPWRGRDDAGRPVAAGIYFYRLEAGEFSGVGRMMLVK